MMMMVMIHCQVREETETRIDVPPEGSDVTVVTISGPKDNVDKAKEMLESTQRALVGIVILGLIDSIIANLRSK